MHPIFRRLRGALGTAFTWAVGWAVAAFSVVSVAMLVTGDLNPFWAAVAPPTILAGASGFVGGTVFSLVLGTFYRKRRLGELKPLWMAAWGAAAGLLLPMTFLGLGLVAGVPLELGDVAGWTLGLGALGAGTGGGIVKLAQMGEGSLPPSSDDSLLGSG